MAGNFDDRSNAGIVSHAKIGSGVHSSLSGLTILVIDDEQDVRTLVARLLARAGHEVLQADHGAEALRIATAHPGPVHLVITDMYMPGLRGPEIVNLLRPKHPAVLALYMSGYGEDQLAHSTVSPGATFLRKPFSTQEFEEALSVVLGKAG